MEMSHSSAGYIGIVATYRRGSGFMSMIHMWASGLNLRIYFGGAEIMTQKLGELRGELLNRGSPGPYGTLNLMKIYATNLRT